MVIYGRVVCKVAALAIFIALTTAAPSSRSRQKYYDQRQNGTENYRMTINDVVVVVPADLVKSAIEATISDETLMTMELLALSFPFSFPFFDKSSNLSDSTTTQIAPADNKPSFEDKPAEEKPIDEKPQEEKPLEEPIYEKPQEQKPLEEKAAEEKPSLTPGDKPLKDIFVVENLLLTEEKILPKEQQSNVSKKSTAVTDVKNIENASS